MSPTAPSGVKSYDGYCVQPADGSCEPGDGTKIKFGEKGPCSDSFMEFSLDANGVLRHHCSGKMVCPDNDNNGAVLGVSSGCTEENSKFTRTEGEFVLNSVQNKTIYDASSPLFPILHFCPMIRPFESGSLVSIKRFVRLRNEILHSPGRSICSLRRGGRKRGRVEGRGAGRGEAREGGREGGKGGRVGGRRSFKLECLYDRYIFSIYLFYSIYLYYR